MKKSPLFISLWLLFCGFEAVEIFSTSDSEKCKSSCIDANNHFCPSADRESGVCCDDTNCEKNDYCSYNAPFGNKALTYWACPTDPSFCGLEQLLVPQTNISENIKPQKNTLSSFNQGQICKYKLIFPQPAGDFD